MELDDLRQKIDALDAQIVRLVNERAAHAQEIGRRKRAAGQSVYAPDREQAVYDRLAGLNRGPLPDRALHSIYREIMSAAIALEGATRISYFGSAGSFTHMAAIEKFGASMEYLPAREIRDVFQSVLRGHADYGVVPIENSTEGSVNQTNDLFLESDLKICSEIFMEVHQNLLARCELGQIRTIASHPQALAQCRNWIAANAGGAEIVETSNTTAAALYVANDPHAAAIASEAAATVHNLPILERSIEDRADNVTRFVVLARHGARPTGRDRTSVMFSLRHEAGSLAESLLIFKNNGINLTRIVSRPCRTRVWEYTFFVDFEGHAEEPHAARALAELRAVSHDFHVLGSYPRAEHPRPVAPAPGEAR